MKTRFLRGLVGGSALIGVCLCSAAASANAVTGQMFYTTYAGGTNIHRVDFNYDGVSTFSLTNNTGIAAVGGADGIAGNPNDPNSLLIGAQGGAVHRVSKTGTLLQTLGTPTAVYHLEVSNSSTLYGTSIPSIGAFSKVQLNGDGTLGPASSIAIVGGGGQITQIITTPTRDYYTASGSGGNGVFGSVVIAGATATLTQLLSPVPAAHGGVYDSFTNSIILFGDGHITQFCLTCGSGGTLAQVADFLSPTGGTYDQGTVDGQGHLFAANNNGYLTFIDYSASGLINAGFTSTQFLAGALDDIAPLVGSGSTQTPEPGTLALLGLGLAGLGYARRRRAT